MMMMNPKNSKMYRDLSEILQKQKSSPLTHPGAPDTLQEAAVLALLFKEMGEDHLLFTKRSQEVLHHKGQICFPGGACDKNDKDLWNTALRETEEEIGLSQGHITFVGELRKIVTPSGYRVTPFVGSLNERQIWNPNPREIKEIFSVPLTYLLDTKNFHYSKKTYKDIEYDDPCFTFRNHEIWGVTARILVEFLEAWKTTLLQKSA